MTTETVADQVAAAARHCGIRTCFGHPGGEVVVLIDSLERQGIRFVLTHHETEAALMASAQAELTGVPGLCLSTLGPGATNMASGVATALLERSPMLALTAATSTSASAGMSHQRIDLNALYGPITKLSMELSAANAKPAAAQALALAMREVRGPVHLSLPGDIAAGSSADDLPASPEPDLHESLDAEGMDSASRLLSQARRIAIITGLRAPKPEIADSVSTLAHAARALVATLPKGKGTFPEDDELFVGTLEMAGGALVAGLMEKADLLIAVGVDLVEMGEAWPFSPPTIVIDSTGNDLRHIAPLVALVGHIERIVLDLALSVARASGWPQGLVTAHREMLRSHVCPDGTALPAWRVVEEVRAAMPRDAIASTDVGIHKQLVGQVWRSYEAQTFLMSNGLSTMGYGLASATAAWVAKQGRRVVAFLGDGGFSMYLGELETLTRIDAGVLIVVFADGSLELIRRAQLLQGRETVGTSFTNPDFQLLAAAFGLACREVRAVDELGEAVHELSELDGVRLLVAHVDGAHYPT